MLSTKPEQCPERAERGWFCFGTNYTASSVSIQAFCEPLVHEAGVRKVATSGGDMGPQNISVR